MQKQEFIPALRFKWLTGLYNPVVAYTMPEVKFKSALIQQANIKSDHRVLDFGVGTATLSLLLSKTQSGCKIDGVDVDEKILKIARKKINEENAEIVLSKYDGLKLPYTNDSFDRVITSLVFHHLDKDQKLNALVEIHRILKTGGELHIADWGKPSNVVMRFAFYLVQILDGFKTTGDNVKGLVPIYMEEAGFVNVKTNRSFNTIFGTLWLYQGIK